MKNESANKNNQTVNLKMFKSFCILYLGDTMTTIPQHNFYWFSGNTEHIDIRLLDEDFSPQDLSTSSARLGLKKKLTDTQLSYALSTEVIGENLNEFIFEIPEYVTDSLLADDLNQDYYLYTINVIDSNAKITTVLTGRITIKRNTLS